MARALTGTLIQRASGWFARITTTVDGKRVRVSRALGTNDRSSARAILADMLKADPGSSVHELPAWKSIRLTVSAADWTAVENASRDAGFTPEMWMASVLRAMATPGAKATVCGEQMTTADAAELGDVLHA